jgi:hypothetical protein
MHSEKFCMITHKPYLQLQNGTRKTIAGDYHLIKQSWPIQDTIN